MIFLCQCLEHERLIIWDHQVNSKSEIITWVCWKFDYSVIRTVLNQCGIDTILGEDIDVDMRKETFENIGMFLGLG